VLVSGSDTAAVRVEPEAEQVPVSSIEQIIDDFSSAGGEVRQAAGTRAGSQTALSLQDFILPEIIQGDTGQPYLLRPRLDRWGEQQVRRYWIALETIALDLVQRENDSRIEKLFNDIP
jgi:hypothetical protein